MPEEYRRYRYSFEDITLSTNIFSIYPVANHIIALEIDARLEAGDVTLLGDI